MRPSGAHGFWAYDPLFWVPERDVSSAELSPADKNQISHRARAMAFAAPAPGLEMTQNTSAQPLIHGGAQTPRTALPHLPPLTITVLR